MTWSWGLLQVAEQQLGRSVADEINLLMRRLSARYRRNRTRSDYYDMHNLFRDLGIAIPPNLRNLEVAMGWPAKAVDQLARRVRMRAWVLPSGNLADFGVEDLWAANSLDVAVPQAQVSALIHSTAFVLAFPGDMQAGEPAVHIRVLDAFDATGIWDSGRQGLRSGLAVLARSDQDRQPTSVLFAAPNAYALFTQHRGVWTVQTMPHGVGRVTMEPLTYRPRLGRPFGSSRISRAVMAITDSAMRTVVRSEVSAEFYSAPQRYILGADEGQFVGPDGKQKSTWDLVMGRILALPDTGNWDDANQGRAEVGTFPQITMQPHTDQLRQWAQLMAAETSLPVSALGIVQDNPSSAEAIYASKEDLLLEAEDCAAGFGTGLIRAMRTAVMLRDGLTTLPPELQGLAIRWMDPSTPSRAAATDAVMKQVQAGVLPAESEVTLEQLDYDRATIDRILAERRTTAGDATLQSLAQAAKNVTPQARDLATQADTGQAAATAQPSPVAGGG